MYLIDLYVEDKHSNYNMFNELTNKLHTDTLTCAFTREKLEEDLAKGGNNDYQTAKLQVQIADLKAKKERQDELAFAFKEDKYVHFYMKDYTLAPL